MKKKKERIDDRWMILTNKKGRDEGENTKKFQLIRRREIKMKIIVKLRIGRRKTRKKKSILIVFIEKKRNQKHRLSILFVFFFLLVLSSTERKRDREKKRKERERERERHSDRGRWSRKYNLDGILDVFDQLIFFSDKDFLRNMKLFVTYPNLRNRENNEYIDNAKNK